MQNPTLPFSSSSMPRWHEQSDQEDGRAQKDSRERDVDSSDRWHEDEVFQNCYKNSNENGFCTNVFNQSIKLLNTNKRGVAEIVLLQGINKATGLAQYAEWLSYGATDPNLLAYLQYATALGGLQNGQVDLQKSKFDDMVNVLLKAAKSIFECEILDRINSILSRPSIEFVAKSTTNSIEVSICTLYHLVSDFG